MKHLLFVALGGAGGAVARYYVSNLINQMVSSRIPLATLSVNLVGSFLIGILYVMIVERMVLHPDWRSVLMVGFLGAFTTFSTFSLETISMLESGQIGPALTYVFASVLLCVLGAWGGLQLARFI